MAISGSFWGRPQNSTPKIGKIFFLGPIGLKVGGDIRSEVLKPPKWSAPKFSPQKLHPLPPFFSLNLRGGDNGCSKLGLIRP